MNNTSSLHLEAYELREHGESAKALAVYSRALSEYIEKKEYEGAVRVLLEMSICYRHLGQEQEDESYFIVGEGSATSAYSLGEVQEISPEVLALAAQELGTYAVFREDFDEAIEWQEEAAANLSDPLQKANAEAHLAAAYWYAGKRRQAEELFKASIEVLAKNITRGDEVTNRTWLSGALLRRAQCYLDGENREKAKADLLNAVDVILAEPKLVIRERQLRALEEQLA